MSLQNFSPAVSAFRALHESGFFILPNPWDVGTARVLHHLGFQALATTSAGVAFSYGRSDTVTALSLDEVLAHVKALVEATPLPVNADFQNGYADSPEDVAANVTRCALAGAAGLSIEDATGNDASPLYEHSLAIERIRAARTAIDACGTGTILTARCEAILLGVPDAEAIVLDRLAAFAEAGADCLYAPRISDLNFVSAIVSAVAPKPVNVLVARPMPGFTVSRLADLGVRRISLGSALSRMAFGAVIHSARKILATGEFDTLGRAAEFSELNQIFEKP